MENYLDRDYCLFILKEYTQNVKSIIFLSNKLSKI
jgi:hypothetical protein